LTFTLGTREKQALKIERSKETNISCGRYEMSGNNSNSQNDQWDERFLLEFEDGSIRKVHAKFIEATSRDKRTGI
jgi:hypothetical protein